MTITWITIHVTNMDESKRFYCDVLGLKVKHEMAPRPGMKICFLDGGPIDYELIEDDGHPEVNIGASVSAGFRVDSLDQKIADLKKKGVENIVGPIQPAPNIRFIYIKDPDGMGIQISERV
ncbi:MAG: VOC family protein [Candidatus Marinimicrobia bacterium]|nr:VOC family protein [Candidatus Neomarinimicrobiota bacterium]